jgi:hypothetical protein
VLAARPEGVPPRYLCPLAQAGLRVRRPVQIGERPGLLPRPPRHFASLN